MWQDGGGGGGGGGEISEPEVKRPVQTKRKPVRAVEGG